MRILADRKGGRITLQPATEEEAQSLRSLAESLTTPRQKLKYAGRKTNDDGETIQLKFEQSDDQIFVLTPTEEEDRNNLGMMRDTCFFGSSGMFYIETVKADGGMEILFTMGQCNVCNRDVITMDEVSWKTCKSCKMECSHEWEEGIIHEGQAIGTGEFCKKCGFGNPDVPMENANPDGVTAVIVMG